MPNERRPSRDTTDAAGPWERSARERSASEHPAKERPSRDLSPGEAPCRARETRRGERWTPPLPAARHPVAFVIDDEPSVRAVVARHLIRLGWAVRAFPAAEAALAWLGDAATEEQPGLVVSDVDMPRMSGLELAAVLRRDYPALGVLLLSGRAAPGLTAVTLPVLTADAGAGAGAGAGEEMRPPEHADAPIWLLGKPYEVRALGDAVERTVLRHWGAPRVGAPS